MKTSSISLRVADFLRQHPPFDALTETERVELAAGGRVKFHEADEIVFTSGEERGRFFWVIQRGTINLYRPTESGEELIDVRVEGDLLGVDWAEPEIAYRATARVAQESILYALPADRMFEFCRRHTAAVAFLQAYFTVRDPAERGPLAPTLVELEADAANWLTHATEVNRRAANRLLTAAPDEPIQVVAARMAPGMQEAMVVVDADRRPIGIVTETDLTARVATGIVPVTAPIAEIMNTPVVTLPRGRNAGDFLMAMLRHRRRHVVVTETGGMDGRVLGIVGEKTVQVLHGNMPVFLAREFRLASDVAELQRLRDRADDLLLRYVEGEAPIDWMTNFIAQTDRMLAEEATRLAREKLMAQGLVEPELPWAWVAFHAEGRKERLLRSSQRTGIIHADLPAGLDPGPVQRWFGALANELGSVFSVCRFPLDHLGRMASNPQWCRSETAWAESFRQWIRHPVASNIIKLTPFFDLRAITGDRSLVANLRAAMLADIDANPEFVPLLATDAMANLPPVTVFRDSVLDQSGGVVDAINTKSNALTPLVDIARVYALGLGLEDATYTPDRYRQAAESLPEHAGMFETAIEAFDHALRLQTRVGLSRGDDARFVRPDELTRTEVQRMKAIFRAVAHLLDETVKHFGLRGR